jgi:hypothetical protein
VTRKIAYKIFKIGVLWQSRCIRATEDDWFIDDVNWAICRVACLQCEISLILGLGEYEQVPSLNLYKDL